MNRLRYRYGAWLILWLVFFSCPHALAAEEMVAIVTHPTVTDSLNKDEIKQIFLGKKTQWNDNSGITFVLLDDDELLTAFLKAYIGKTPDQFKNYWKKQVFTGKGKMPKVYQTSAELIKFLVENQGSISVMRREDVDQAQVNILSLQP